MSNLIHSNSIFATQLNSLNGNRIWLGNAEFACGIPIDSSTPIITATFNGIVGVGTLPFTQKSGSDRLLEKNRIINKSIFPCPVGLYHSPPTAAGGGATS